VKAHVRMQDSLRRRFANSLAQYQVLVRVTRAEVDHQLAVTRELVVQEAVDSTIPTIPPSDELVTRLSKELPDIDDQTAVTERNYINGYSPDGVSQRVAVDVPGADNLAAPTLQHRTRPSAYLRSRCPQCLGGFCILPPPAADSTANS
jgi:hypothetical protein